MGRPLRRLTPWTAWCAAAAWLSGCAPAGEQPLPDPCEVAGNICTWMGFPELALFTPPGRDRLQSGLYLPQDLQFGPDGVGYVADFNNHRVLSVQPDGLVDIVAGTGFPGDGASSGEGCDDGCDSSITLLWHPSQVVIDPRDPDQVITAAWHDHRVVSSSLSGGESTWILGDGDPGFGNDPVSLSYPSSVAVDADGTYYVADQGNQIIRRVGPAGEATILAGTPGLPGYQGDGGPAAEALLHGHTDWVGGPTSKITLRGRELFLADTVNGVIRKIDLDTGLIDRVAGKYQEGEGVGSESGFAGDGGDALDAVLAIPRAVAFGLAGEMYIADSGNNCVRVVDPDGVISTFAGRCGEEGGFAGDDGPAVEATLAFPCGVVVDEEGYVYISDSNNHVIRRVAPYGAPSE